MPSPRLHLMKVVPLVEAGFGKAHPGTRVEIIWRRSGDAMG